MGGLPRLGDLDWPHCGGRALHFLAQIDMGDLARLAPLTGLPTSGSLAFFADTVGWQTARVLHVPGDQMARPDTPQPNDIHPPSVPNTGGPSTPPRPATQTRPASCPAGRSSCAARPSPTTRERRSSGPNLPPRILRRRSPSVPRSCRIICRWGGSPSSARHCT
nr:DUF1963 domain-containing protein [Tabrizicola flagellatus]